MSDLSSTVAADAVVAAAQMNDVVRRTPLADARWLSEPLGVPVHLKCENLQRAGSFKIRGAYTRINRLSAEERARGVVAASAGNHAQGVALAGAMLDTSVTVYMPEGASLVKERATRGYGADVRNAGATVDEAVQEALRHAERTGAVFVHPFDHPDVVAGQGSVGLEVLEQAPDAATVVVCCGGGGLLAGMATVIKNARPDIRVVGVQASGASAYLPSLAAGEPVALTQMSTMADGIAVARPGDLPFALITEHVDEIVTVDEDAIAAALVRLLERNKLVAEPAGAVAVAALAGGKVDVSGPVVATVSGGNIDPLLVMRVIRHGMRADGRYLAFTTPIRDSPGGLAQLIALLADLGANVLDVVHERTRATLAVGDVYVAVNVETRGPKHRATILAGLAAEGYVVRE
ncbi:MAG: threonine ammonia-lyase [Jiangellales bacterium]